MTSRVDLETGCMISPLEVTASVSITSQLDLLALGFMTSHLEVTVGVRFHCLSA